MTGIYGLLGLQDGDATYIKTMGESLVYEAATKYLQMASAEANQVYSVFIEAETEDYKRRYKLPGGGRMQKAGKYASNAAVRAIGGWDVAFPITSYEEPVAESYIDMALATVADVNQRIETIRIRHINALRFGILKRILNSGSESFVDERNGTLTVVPLANGDSALYPPVQGSEAEATENHYLESGYAASSISDSNQPFTTLRNELEEHFGVMTGYGNIAVFMNQAQVAKTQDLTDFDPVTDRHILPGANADVPTGLPTLPGRIFGRCDGVWTVQWDWIPANYLVAIDLDQPAPLLKRRYPAVSGLSPDVYLAGTDVSHPLYSTHYRAHYGFGAGNRLNGVVMELGTGGSYSIPSDYA